MTSRAHSSTLFKNVFSSTASLLQQKNVTLPLLFKQALSLLKKTYLITLSSHFFARNGLFIQAPPSNLLLYEKILLLKISWWKKKWSKKCRFSLCCWCNLIEFYAGFALLCFPFKQITSFGCESRCRCRVCVVC